MIRRKPNLSPEMNKALDELQKARQDMQAAIFVCATGEARKALKDFWLVHNSLIRTWEQRV